jgi:6-phosphogluconolactonase
VHFVPVDRATPQIAAAEYERELRRIVGDAGLDLVLLGLGADGHTASLFPGDPALEERERWVVATRAPSSYPVRDRITLTLTAIAKSRDVFFLVTGKDKAAAVARARAVPATNAAASLDSPSARVRARESVIWFLDTEAASASR